MGSKIRDELRMPDKPRIYLDNCCFNRPFDDRSQLIVRLEAEAVLAIQNGIRNEEYELVWSYILDEENAACPFPLKRQLIKIWKQWATVDVEPSDDVLQAAQFYGSKGLKTMDSLHLACAECAGTNFFVTTDLGILKKRIDKVPTLNPIDFVRLFNGGMNQ
jgi:predicted nucleic acid-binding protein